jgi:hypothetical protein
MAMGDLGEAGIMTRRLRVAHRVIVTLLAVILPLVMYVALSGREPLP